MDAASNAGRRLGRGWHADHHIDSSNEAIKGLLRHFTADQLRAALDALAEPPAPGTEQDQITNEGSEDS